MTGFQDTGAFLDAAYGEVEGWMDGWRNHLDYYRQKDRMVWRIVMEQVDKDK